LFRPTFNRSIRIETRQERLTTDPGAVLLREIMERLGIVGWLANRITDPRRPELVVHPTRKLLRTAILLLAQGWRDQDDADLLRHDPALCLAVSCRKGTSPLSSAPGRGLPSQPTLSRCVRWLATPGNRRSLREALVECARRRVLAQGRGRLQRITLDVDSLPVEVHGAQPGSQYHGYYKTRIYHPIVALAAETGDSLDIKLREGAAHTAAGALQFILELVDRVKGSLCEVAAVRLDAGFPDEGLLCGLEARGIPYVARIRNNSVLDRMAWPYLKRPPGRPPREPRTWLYEMSYQARSWSRPRRAVLVVQERPGELFLHHFWLITSWTQDQMHAEALLEHYRQRGTAEGYLGELMNVLRPALSSSPRPKRHYRGREPRERYPSGDAFSQNEVRLLLAGLAYNLIHAARVLLEQATRRGWSLEGLRERVLRVAARVVVHGRRVTMVVSRWAAWWWRALWGKLVALKPMAP
jgi:hypothetical protein